MSENSEISEQQILINEFLAKVKRRLPLWLLTQKEDLEEVLEELENHIWDRATELAQGYEPTPEQIMQVLYQMGSPEEIAREYRRRGKPKIFISEELFPWYWKVLSGAAALVFVISFLSMLFSIGSLRFGVIVGNFFDGLFTGLLIAFVVVSIIFVGLSMQGFLPEDFKRINVVSFRDWVRDRKAANESEAKATKQTEKSYAEVSSPRAAAPVAPPTPSRPAAAPPPSPPPPSPPPAGVAKVAISAPKVSKNSSIKVMEPRVTRETKYVEVAPERKRKPKYRRRGDYLAEGISGLVIGVLLIGLRDVILQPLTSFFGGYMWAIREWMGFMALVIIASGAIRFIQALVGNHKHWQQFLTFLHIIPEGFSIYLFYQLLTDPNLYTPFVDYFGANSWAITGMKIAVWVVISITIITILADVVRIVKIGVMGFPEEKDRENTYVR